METQRYLYETHMHTSEASACAGSTGTQMARAYKAAGLHRHYCNGSLFLRKYFGGPFPAVGGVGTALLSRI